MSLFHKNKTEDEVTNEPLASASPAIGTVDAASPKTTEERVREWWMSRYNEPMPDDLVNWMRQLTRAEARRRTIAASLLTPQQQARIQDARQLAETRLNNIESSMQRLYAQREWLRRFNETKQELAEHQSRLYEMNKRLAAQADEESELLRFETFETIQGLFQRMMLLEEHGRENKQARSAMIRETETAQQEVTEKQNTLNLLINDSEEKGRALRQTCDQMVSACRVQGERTVLDLDKASTQRLEETIAQQQLILDKEIAELNTEIEGIDELAIQQRVQRQAMEPHQRLMEHAEMAMTQLKRLYQLKTEIESLSNTLEDTLRQQREENEMLARIFSTHREVDADIKILQGELFMHRQQNLGRSSHSLQGRAMELKTRRQMLIAAQSLWNRIKSGYQLIEDKTRTVNQLRLDIDYLKQNIAELESKVVPMRQLCHEKEYTLTLSKSQNVIQLRNDLKEGTSCTVCGATHHPYHSNTMLEQSKLISDMRTEFELQQAELASKERQLLELRTTLAATTARRDVEEETLSRLRQRQMEDVKEWSVFAPLDRTFSECSSSTNTEARTTMLRQLIENTVHDADDAQKELDEYNFHQTRINEINEAVTKKEQRRNELVTRLNEVNTGCQVLVRKIELLRQNHSELNDEYTRLYEQLNGLITLDKWYPLWKINHEAILLRIEQMMEQWRQLNTDIPQLNHRLEILQTALDDKHKERSFLSILADQIHNDEERRQNIRKEGDKTYEAMMGHTEVKEAFEQSYNQLVQAFHNESKHRDNILQATTQLSTLQGRQQELSARGEKLDSESIDIKSKVDVWIRQFNANNPPVQYAELAEAFDLNKDWNAIRAKTRETRIQSILEQTRVDALRNAIVVLQADGLHLSNENEADSLELLVQQEKQLADQRQKVLEQIAEYHIALKNHEECQAQLKAEEEALYALTDKQSC